MLLFIVCQELKSYSGSRPLSGRSYYMAIYSLFVTFLICLLPIRDLIATNVQWTHQLKVLYNRFPTYFVYLLPLLQLSWHGYGLKNLIYTVAVSFLSTPALWLLSIVFFSLNGSSSLLFASFKITANVLFHFSYVPL